MKSGVDIDKKVLTILSISMLIIVSNITSIHTSSDSIVIAVFGSTPIIDGSIEAGEWNDAFIITIPVTNNTDCTVYIKQDGANLYLGFHTPDITYNGSDRCVVILDINYDQSTSLQADDKWLAVFRGDNITEYNVTSSGWFPTKVSGWTANSSSTASIWQSEYNITYSKLHVNPSTSKTLGVAFLVVDEDVEMGWRVWPERARILIPSTWNDVTSNGYNWAQKSSFWTSLFPFIIVLITGIIIVIVVRAGYKRRIRKRKR